MSFVATGLDLMKVTGFARRVLKCWGTSDHSMEGIVRPKEGRWLALSFFLNAYLFAHGRNMRTNCSFVTAHSTSVVSGVERKGRPYDHGRRA